VKNKIWLSTKQLNYCSKNNRKRGFTLIELLVVISIIGVLATMVAMNVKRNLLKANYTKTLADMTAIADALKLYHAEENAWPADTANVGHYEVGTVPGTTSSMKDFIDTKFNGVISNPPCSGARYGIETASYIAVVYFPAVDGPFVAPATQESVGGTSWAVAQISIEDSTSNRFPSIASKTDKSITCNEYSTTHFN